MQAPKTVAWEHWWGYVSRTCTRVGCRDQVLVHERPDGGYIVQHGPHEEHVRIVSPGVEDVGETIRIWVDGIHFGQPASPEGSDRGALGEGS